MSKAPNDTSWKEVQEDVGRSFRDYANLSLTSIINSLYLVLWAAIQWLTHNFLAKYELIGMDTIVLNIFQVLFAITTVIPPCMYIYRDFRIAWLKINRQIENAADRRKRK